MLPQFLAESLHMNKQSIALLVGVALWLTACNSSKPSMPAGARQAVVPLGDAGALVFSASGAETVRGSQRSAFAASLPSGSPLAAANDPSSGWSALAYNDAIVVVNASEARVKRVDGVSWSSAPTALGIGGTTVGTLEDGTIALYDALEGRRLWKEDGRALLLRLGLEDLRYVMPVSRDRMLVVAFKQMSAFDQPQAMVVDIDRSAGQATSQERPFGQDLHWLDACTGDGSHLYVAGTTQAVENIGPRQQQMTKTIVVLRHDPVRSRNQILVRARQQPGTEVKVAHLAAGWGLVAYSLDDGRVNVYDASGDREAAHLWGKPIKNLEGIVCVDASHVAFTAEGRTFIERVR